MRKQLKGKQTGRRVWPWLAAAVIWLLVIWGNSLRPADESAAQSRWVMQILTPLLRLTGLPETVWHTLVRKLAHMTEFALLSLLWTCVLMPKGRNGGFDGLIRVLGLCLLAAMLDETIQLFVLGRSSQVTDVWIDFLGAGLGMLAALLPRRIAARRARKESGKTGRPPEKDA